jgi:hypothetical protein
MAAPSNNYPFDSLEDRANDVSCDSAMRLGRLLVLDLARWQRRWLCCPRRASPVLACSKPLTRRWVYWSFNEAMCLLPGQIGRAFVQRETFCASFDWKY